MSILVKIRCNGENLSFIRRPVITSGDQNVVRCKFCFGPEWDKYTKTATFTRNNEPTVTVPITDDECIIPYTILSCKCKLYIGVIGVNGDKRITSRLLTYDIIKGAGESSSIMPTTEQLNAAIKSYCEGQNYASKEYVDSKQCECSEDKFKQAVDDYCEEKNLATEGYVNDSINAALIEMGKEEELNIVLNGSDVDPNTTEDNIEYINLIFDGGIVPSK